MKWFGRKNKNDEEANVVSSKEYIVEEENILYMIRFCGVEKYPLKKAQWYIIDGDGTEDDPAMLCLDTSFDTGSQLHEDTTSLDAEPIWEVEFYSIDIPISDLQPGFCMEQPNVEEDIYGNLYYGEHQPTIDNHMEILEREGNRLKIRLTAITEDVNFYDGSKPKSVLHFVGWFDQK